jgi:hypothetical protein
MLAAFREKPDRFGVFRHWLATPWFHGPIAREEAERRLRRTEPKDGGFLTFLRSSTKTWLLRDVQPTPHHI